MKTKLHFVVLIALLCYGTISYGNFSNTKFNTKGLSSIVTDPLIVVQGNLVTISNGDSTPSETDNTVFHSAQVAGETRTAAYVIANGDASPFTISSIVVSGVDAADFTVTTMPLSTVASGDKTSFVVTFNPSAVGMRNATITIDFSSPSSFSYSFAVQGKGLSYTPCSFKTLVAY